MCSLLPMLVIWWYALTNSAPHMFLVNSGHPTPFYQYIKYLFLISLILTSVAGSISMQTLSQEQFSVIEPSESSWTAPVVLVRKSDGTLQNCIDYGKLNQITQKDSYNLSNIQGSTKVQGQTSLSSQPARIPLFILGIKQGPLRLGCNKVSRLILPVTLRFSGVLRVL